MAGTKGLEPSTFGVTGRNNQLEQEQEIIINICNYINLME
jgi:hypothetical protein